MAKTKEVDAELELYPVVEIATTPEAIVELSEADREIIDAGDLAEKFAVENGIKLKVKVNAPATERQQLTSAQYMKRANSQREIGLLMLNNRRAGLAAVTQVVKIDNYLVAASFTRFFSVIDQCLYTLRSQGEYRLGKATANKLTNQILLRIAEFTSQANSELAASAEVVAEVITRANSVTPSYTSSAYVGEVQVKTPEALALVKAFHQLDETVLNIETLHWNGERNQGDVQDAIKAQKRAITPLFVLCMRTSIQIRNLVKNHAQ